MKNKKLSAVFLILIFSLSFCISSNGQTWTTDEEEQILQAKHSISSHKLLKYIKILASEKFNGRLTGSKEYKYSVDFTASFLKKRGISPAGKDNTYLQSFPNPYTIISKGSEAYLHIPYKNSVIKKHYNFDNEYIPGGTSGSGEITAEVVYAGYGITAPELGYDDYKNVDVKDKIVLIESEGPVSSNKDTELFKKWRKYTFHQYKLENAVAHGAKGMLYNYGPIGNPNNSYDRNFIYHHVGSVVTNDIFSGAGKDHKTVVEKIKKELKPFSFHSGMTFTVKNETEHFPDGTGYNVIGIIEGSDPVLKDECIIVGGHLDHLGRSFELMPGANDNASGIAVMLGVAEAIKNCRIKPKRSVMFIFFGAEEQAVKGSDFYLKDPSVPLEKTVGFINIDGVGCGDKLRVTAGKNFPQFWNYIDTANKKYIHRQIRTSFFLNNARPRLDAARFMWAGIPSLSFGAYGSRSFYHNTKDTVDRITPEIIEDTAQLIFLAVLNITNADKVNFRQ